MQDSLKAMLSVMNLVKLRRKLTYKKLFDDVFE